MITLTNGHVQNQAGMAVPNGSVTFQLNIDATVVANPYGLIPAEQLITFQFDSSGNILPLDGQSSAQIYSNAELNPQNSSGLGTYYLVTFYDANGARINKNPMWWQFTEAANSTVDISTMTPFSTIGGNVIFYPTTFTIEPPGPSTLGGVFSNVGAASQWIRAINTNGSVTLSQPSFADISGTLSAAQLPSPLTFTIITASGLITAQAGVQIGVAGTTAGQITLEGSTSGACTITAPAVAGTASNPILFSNGINIPNSTVFSINTDTGISRGGSAGVLDVGNGTAGNASGTVNAAQYNVAGAQIKASNLSNGVTGTGAIVLAASPTVTGTLTTAAISATTISASGLITATAGVTASALITATTITASGLITASAGARIATGQVLQFNTDTGISRDSAGVIDIGNGTAGDKTGTIQATTIVLSGTITVGGSAPTVGAGLLGLGSGTSATATAGAATLPANPVGFLVANLAGTTIKIPYYAT